MGYKLKIREEAKKLNPIDDLLFRKMAEDREFCEEILQVILSDPGLTVLECTPQYDATNLQGRSATFDARCILGSGKQVIIEVQKADDDNHQKRMRYNGALLTTNITDPGEKFQDVPNVCAVFISRFDIFDGGLPLYHVDRVIRENGESLRKQRRDRKLCVKSWKRYAAKQKRKAARKAARKAVRKARHV